MKTQRIVAALRKIGIEDHIPAILKIVECEISELLKEREDKKYRISDEEMYKAIDNYNKAKEDGTLDEKYPVVGNVKDMLNDKQEERKFDESRLVYLWEKDSYKELRAYFIDCFERLLTTPNPSYSQDEVDRLRSKDHDTLIEKMIELPTTYHAIDENDVGAFVRLDLVKQIILEIMSPTRL
jgi:hypothetical protein